MACFVELPFFSTSNLLSFSCVNNQPVIHDSILVSSCSLRDLNIGLIFVIFIFSENTPSLIEPLKIYNTRFFLLLDTFSKSEAKAKRHFEDELLLFENNFLSASTVLLHS